MTFDATVVIPAYNAGDTIEQQLAALAHQDCTQTLEVIVADNGSTDDTDERVRRWTMQLPGLRIVDASSRRGVAHARNCGFAAASTEQILVCDADDVADASWASRLLEELSTADLVAGGALARPARADAVLQPCAAQAPEGIGRSGLGFFPVVIGSSFAARRQAWRDVGGFDEGLPRAEDFDFAYNVQLAGLRFVARPDAFVHYRVPVAIPEAMQKYFAYGRYQPLLYRKHRDHGMPRRSASEVVKVWLRLARRSPELLASRDERRRWCERFAHLVGRIVGSVEFRTVFL